MLLRHDALMRIIAFITQKGGSGKSTLCTNLAVAATEAGENVLLVDLDDQGTTAEWGKMRTGAAPAVAALPKADSARLPALLETQRYDRRRLVLATYPPDERGRQSEPRHRRGSFAGRETLRLPAQSMPDNAW
jgi:energy-coupling factor transporter ATP-binding protein EcfA2